METFSGRLKVARGEVSGTKRVQNGAWCGGGESVITPDGTKALRGVGAA